MSLMNSLEQMKPGNKIGLSFGVLLIIALMFATGYWLLHEKYSVLFTQVNQQDAAGILSELERMKVEYRLEDGGSRILVPDSTVHETRLKLMGSGTRLSGGVGFEVFDNAEFGMTEFAQKINFQRALQGELTRTIMSLRAVKFARVHLVMPERGLFKQNDAPSSASVTIFFQPGQRLQQQQIIGVQQLVAAAVPGLAARHVTLSDQDGATLSSITGDGDDEMQKISGRLAQKKAVEEYLAGKANEVLARAFGPHQAMVSVDVMLDFNQVKTTREDINPDPKGRSSNVLRRRESKFAGNQKNAADGSTATTEIEYMHGRTIAEVIATPGGIERLNVGVVVPPDADETRYAKIRELVAVTVGFNKARGDAIAIYPANPVPTKVVEVDSKPLPPTLAEIDALKVTSSANSKSSPQLDEFVLLIKTQPLLVGGLVLMALLLILLMMMLLVTRGRSNHAEISALSEEQREQLLLDLQTWLASDEDLAREKTA